MKMPSGETETEADIKLAEDGQSIWVKFEDIILSKDDQNVLLSGGLLQDSISTWHKGS